MLWQSWSLYRHGWKRLTGCCLRKSTGRGSERHGTEHSHARAVPHSITKHRSYPDAGRCRLAQYLPPRGKAGGCERDRSGHEGRRASLRVEAAGKRRQSRRCIAPGDTTRRSERTGEAIRRCTKRRTAGTRQAAQRTAVVVVLLRRGLIALPDCIRGRNVRRANDRDIQRIGQRAAHRPTRPDRCEDLHQQGIQDDRKKSFPPPTHDCSSPLRLGLYHAERPKSRMRQSPHGTNGPCAQSRFDSGIQGAGVHG